MNRGILATALLLALSFPCAAFASALPSEVPQTDALPQRMENQEEIGRRREIAHMCEALEEDSSAYYSLPDTESAFSFLEYKYDEDFSQKARSAAELASKASDMRDFLEDEDLAYVESFIAPTCLTDASEALTRLKSICERAVSNRERYEEEQRAVQTASHAQPSGDSFSGPSSGLTKEGGVNYYGGKRETYYSSNVLYHYRTPEWTLDSEGFYRDSSGRYVVASTDVPQGTVISTSKGEGIVLDSGCDPGTVDFYVAW